MRYYQFSLVIILILLGASNAWALDGTAIAECVGGTHVVTVGGSASGEEDITGLVFKCQAIGVCEPSFFFPETPLPFDPQPDGSGDLYFEAEVTITPPLEGVAYRYSPYGVQSDGSLVHAQHHCSADGRTYALASCEETPIHRATLEFYYADGDVIHFLLAPCDQNCWTEGLMTTLTSTTVEDLFGQPWQILLGQAVDLFGTRTYCGMPGMPSHNITRIALAPAGSCGAVATEHESWDSVKAMYR